MLRPATRQLLVVLAGLGGAAPGSRAQTAGERAAVQRAIETTHAAAAGEMKRGDAAALATHYTDDAVLLPPNADMLRGRAAIQKWYWDFLASSTVQDFAVATEDVTVLAATAYEVGRYRITFVPRGAQPISDQGKYLVVWELGGDGQWRMARDMFNTSLPVPGSK